MSVRALDHAFFDAGIMIRPAGDTIELTPPLILSENDIGEIMDKVGRFDQSGGVNGERAGRQPSELSFPARAS